MNSRLPKVIKEDENRGLILGMDASAFCTELLDKPDKKQTDMPKNLTVKNAATLQQIRGSSTTISGQPQSLLVMLYGNDSKLFPKWRHTDEKVKLTFTQRVLDELAFENGRISYAMTMRLSPTFGKLILREGGASFLNDRIKKELGRKLGRPVFLWVILEAVTSSASQSGMSEIYQREKASVDTKTGVLHAHGSIELLPKEMKLFKSTMIQLNGLSMPSATKLKRIYDGDGWAGYCTKHAQRNKAFLPGIKRIAGSRAFSNRAGQLYKEASTKHKNKQAAK
jgi:hypothetical protein